MFQMKIVGVFEINVIVQRVMYSNKMIIVTSDGNSGKRSD